MLCILKLHLYVFIPTWLCNVDVIADMTYCVMHIVHICILTKLLFESYTSAASTTG